jgi:hypothetical protein
MALRKELTDQQASLIKPLFHKPTDGKTPVAERGIRQL